MIDCTVVIATYNRRELLNATLAKLCAWTAWLRRSAGGAWRATARLMRRPVDPRVEALIDSVTELPA